MRWVGLRRFAFVAGFVVACSRDAASPYIPPGAEDWLRDNTAALRSISLDDTDFSDLAPLGRAIGDARVVLLGEPTHGDGSTFEAKARVIRYLHEVKGFDVLWKNSTMRPFGYATMTGDWPRSLDGIVYTRDMVPSARSQ